jgi:pyridoxamine 5'-phosphate oxidase
MRDIYSNGEPETLTNGDFTRVSDPFSLFNLWFEDASAKEINDPNAMALATTGPDLSPNVRMVLLKGIDSRGFTFFTNSESQKGGELAANPQAALVFHWKSLNRQVRVRGRVEQVTADEADAYFASRPRDSRIAAWASSQSRELESRAVFDAAVAKFEKEFEGKDVPRPDYWNGYRVVPTSIEFWHDRPFRKHDRIVFTRAADGWEKTRLYP